MKTIPFLPKNDEKTEHKESGVTLKPWTNGKIKNWIGPKFQDNECEEKRSYKN